VLVCRVTRSDRRFLGLPATGPELRRARHSSSQRRRRRGYALKQAGEFQITKGGKQTVASLAMLIMT